MQGTIVLHTFVSEQTVDNVQFVGTRCSIIIEKDTIMYVENVKSQMRKGMLEYCVMLLLSKKSYYSSDIIDELERANLIVVEGTLYPLLSRLKKEALLDYEWQESGKLPEYESIRKIFYGSASD